MRCVTICITRLATWSCSKLAGCSGALPAPRREDQVGLRGVTWTNRAEDVPLFLESALVQLGGKLALGEVGQLSPLLARQFDLRDAVLLAELNFDTLLARRTTTKSFKSLPQF